MSSRGFRGLVAAALTVGCAVISASSLTNCGEPTLDTSSRDTGGTATTDVLDLGADTTVGDDGLVGGPEEVDGGMEGWCRPDAGECGEGYVCDSTTGACDPVGVIKVDPATLDFGWVDVGTMVMLSLTISNSGQAALTVQAVSFEAGTSPDFTFETARSLPLTLGPSEWVMLDVTFTPSDNHSQHGSLLISSDDLRRPLMRVPLLGNWCDKCPPDLQLVDATTDPPMVLYPVEGSTSTFAWDVGDTAVGASKSATLTILNAPRGDTILGIDSVTVTPKTANAFTISFADHATPSQTREPPLYLNADDMMDMTVVYAPTVVADADETDVVITTNDTDINDDGAADEGVLTVRLIGRAL